MTGTAGGLTALRFDDEIVGRPFARLAVEAVAVSHGLKPAARFTARRADAASACQWLNRAGLATATYEPQPGEWGYRHATPAERAACTASDVRVYYSANVDSLDLAMAAQYARNDEALGRALGYPDCCIAANRLLGGLPTTDMVRVARTARPRDWRLNIFLTEMDMPHGSPFYLISHFPCRLCCPASIAYAAAVHDALVDTLPRFAAKLDALLSLPVLLRDEQEPPASRRRGNFGCVLHGLATDDAVLYDSWHSLRREDRLTDAALDRGDCLTWDDGGIDVVRISSGECVGRLGSDRWQLVTF